MIRSQSGRGLSEVEARLIYTDMPGVKNRTKY